MNAAGGTSRLVKHDGGPSQGHLAQADLRAAVCAALGAGALLRRDRRAGRSDGVLSQRLRDRAGGADLCMAGRVDHGGAHLAPNGPCSARRHQRRRHVSHLRVAGAAAAGRRDRDFVCRTADHRGVRRMVPRRARAHLPLVGGRSRVCRRHRDALALPQPDAVRGGRCSGTGCDHRRDLRARPAPSPTPAR